MSWLILALAILLVGSIWWFRKVPDQPQGFIDEDREAARRAIYEARTQAEHEAAMERWLRLHESVQG